MGANNALLCECPDVSQSKCERGKCSTPLEEIRLASLGGAGLSHISNCNPRPCTRPPQCIRWPLSNGWQEQHFPRMVHMTISLSELEKKVMGLLITHLAKDFDVIAQDVHHVVGAHRPCRRGPPYVVGAPHLDMLNHRLGFPKGTIQGVQLPPPPPPPFPTPLQGCGVPAAP